MQEEYVRKVCWIILRTSGCHSTCNDVLSTLCTVCIVVVFGLLASYRCRFKYILRWLVLVDGHIDSGGTEE